MFGRWRQSRLQAVRRALADARLDEAVKLLSGFDNQTGEEALELRSATQRLLVARARVCIQEGALGQAEADLAQAAALGPLPPDADGLQARLLAAARPDKSDQADAKALAHLRHGRLDSVRSVLPEIEDEQRRTEITAELDARLARLRARLELAHAALERGDVLAAADLWNDARQRFGQTAELDTLGRRLSDALRSELLSWLRDGRVDWLMAAEPALQALSPLEPRLAEDARVLRLLAQATRQLALREFSEVREILLRLAAVRPNLGWVGTCQEALDQIRRGEETLLSSPLGVFVARRDAQDAASAAAPASAAPPFAAASAAAPNVDARDHAMALSFDRPRLALVDGAGSVLLAPAGRVRIGRAGAGSVEVPIPADLLSHHAEIERRGDDYVLSALGPAQVNRKAFRAGRLHDGDRVALGSQARFVFSRPTAKSESAVLRLSHRCRLAQDVGLVVLLSDTCVIGPQPGSHIRTADGFAPVVLFVQAGRLFARPPHGPPQAVPAGIPLEFGEIRFTVTEYRV